ncbi:signal recognition particle-docking protein FtsY [Longilinea arvoryzae]|uniref:Signal recognition particle receptor FtsY n=1 Tax=Longilinea arvoryzae TaxID=360412 RepID=A0A0S7BKH5_9CHLR|nr:signal recognition particle-docking protein FtsY [Longilinea arvoryzae]GAP14856.1 signal recognition particle-docking protein FtsY [Longilinea arvoryzae]
MFNKWIEGLNRTRKVAFGRLATLFGATDISAETWDELEAILIQADLGVETTESILAVLQDLVNREGLTHTDELQSSLRAELIRRLDAAPAVDFDSHKPTIVLVVGVNGSGKTTTIAKLGRQYAMQGKKVLLAAADTYRAAAVDQLQVWGERLNIPVIAGQPEGDPGAVAFDAVQAALSRKMDIVLIDTAGRLHTRYNLMEELKKVYRVVGKALPGAPHATWLVLDATTGQNALQQARAFKETAQVSGVILAKLDSSAKGGMAFAIQKELGLPILYAGLGERPEDLQPFDREAFVDGILGLKN